MSRWRRSLNRIGLLGLAAIASACASTATAPAAPDASGSAQTLRVMTYNIHHGAGNDDCITPPGPPGGPPTADCGLNLERIATGIREANVDVAGLQEVDRFWARSGGVDQAAALGAMLFAALSDAWAIAGSGPGFTSPASPREAPRNRIDYVLASRGVTVKAAAVRATPHTALASDHYPIVADLTIELPRAASSARRQLHD